MRPEQDAFGRALLDRLEGNDRADVIIERDDGFIEAERAGDFYVRPRRRWWPPERQAMRLARGRVLDVGCGAGRVLLDLQERGFDAVGIDHSPGAVAVCRRRGARDVRELGFEDVDESLGRFDTIVLYANNLGLLGGVTRGRRLLRRLHGITTNRARILGGSYDPYTTETEVHRAYHRRNRRRGRLGGQLRLRLRYRELATPWFDWVLLAPSELEELVAGTGWHVARRFDGTNPDVYIAVLEKEH